MLSERDIIAINSGSSGIKSALYRTGADETAVFSGNIGGIGAGSQVYRGLART
jgi:acetate kinase